MSLESKMKALIEDIENWWKTHVEHPSVGSIAQAHLNTVAKPELVKVLAKAAEPEVTPAPVTNPAPSSE
jgi:hypothetical protein